jgi:hypothetical protein
MATCYSRLHTCCNFGRYGHVIGITCNYAHSDRKGDWLMWKRNWVDQPSGCRDMATHYSRLHTGCRIGCYGRILRIACNYAHSDRKGDLVNVEKKLG